MRWVFLAAALVAGGAHAHGGGLNAEGCHNNRRTGDYHCHGGGGSSQARSAPSQQAQRQNFSAPRSEPGRPTCYTGPRGGTYTITRSGRKNYSGC